MSVYTGVGVLGWNPVSLFIRCMTSSVLPVMPTLWVLNYIFMKAFRTMQRIEVRAVVAVILEEVSGSGAGENSEYYWQKEVGPHKNMKASIFGCYVLSASEISS